MKFNWRINHHPIFDIPGRKDFPSFWDHVTLAVAILAFVWVMHDYMRANHIQGQWGTTALYLARNAWRAIIHPRG